MEGSTPQSRANDSNDWRRRDGPALPSAQPSSSNWSRQKLQRDNRGPASPTNGTRHSNAYPVKTTHHVEENTDEIDYSKRIYLGNLLYFATEDDVKTLLEGFDYAKIVISIDPFTGRNPSYCFIDFNSESEAQRALTELDGQILLKRPVKTRPATRPGEGPKKYEPTRSRPPQASWKEPPPDRQQAFAFNRWQKGPSEAREHHVPDEGCRVWIGSLPSFNLDPVHVQTNVRSLFKDNGFNPTAISKIIPPSPANKQSDGHDHYCFVDLATKEEAAQAAESLNDMTPTWGGRTLKVRVSDRGSSWKVHQRKDYVKQHSIVSPLHSGSKQASLVEE